MLYAIDSGTDYLNDSLKEQFDVVLTLVLHHRNCEASPPVPAEAGMSCAVAAEVVGVVLDLEWAVIRREWEATTAIAGASGCTREAGA